MRYLLGNAAALTAVLLLVAVMPSCASSPSSKAPSDKPGFFADPVDFIGVNFKARHPTQDEELKAALSGPGDLKALENDLAVLKKMPADIPLRVVGHTDSEECSGDTCSELSLRRAKAVHDWLLGQGIPESRMSAPRGYGMERPVGDNTTEEGRARNRRAYVSYYEDAP